MERPTFVSRSSSSISRLLSKNEKPLLPRSVRQKSRTRTRIFLAHSLYRKLILWTAAAILLFFFAATSSNTDLRRQRLLGLVNANPYEDNLNNDVNNAANGDQGVVVVVTGPDRTPAPAWREGMQHWLKFKQ